MIHLEPWYLFASPSQEILRLVKELHELSPNDRDLEDPTSAAYHALSQLDRLLERSGQEVSSDRRAPGAIDWYVGMLLNYYRYPNYREWLNQSYELVYTTPRWKMDTFTLQEGLLEEGQETIGPALAEETGRDLYIGDNILQLLLMHRNSYPGMALPKSSVAVLRKAVAWWISNVLSVREDQHSPRSWNRIDYTDEMGRGVSFAPDPASFARR